MYTVNSMEKHHSFKLNSQCISQSAGKGFCGAKTLLQEFPAARYPTHKLAHMSSDTDACIVHSAYLYVYIYNIYMYKCNLLSHISTMQRLAYAQQTACTLVPGLTSTKWLPFQNSNQKFMYVGQEANTLHSDRWQFAPPSFIPPLLLRVAETP